MTEGRDGRVLVCCFADCSTEAVVEALGLSTSDLFPDSQSREEPLAVYMYVDEEGLPLFEVVRFPGKRFRQRRVGPNRERTWKLGDVRRVLFRLPQVLAAVERGETVFVCEGEKDALAVEVAGCVGTCNPGGAGKWREEYSGFLADAHVVVVADRDESGRRHASQVAHALRSVAATVSVVEPTEGKDVSDHLAAGRTLAELVPADLASPGTHPINSDLDAARELAMGADLFHTPGNDPFATFPVDAHMETWPLRSRRFKIWFSGRLWEARRRVPTSKVRNDLLTLLEGIALHDGAMHEVHLRLAPHGDDAICLDLGDAAWSVVEISADGWEVTGDSSVRFRRSAGTQPLPLPERGGSIDDLRPFVNVDRDGWILYVSWLVACFRPHGPYPVLDLLGEQGAAKSTAAHVARDLVDPSRAPLRTAPRDPRDFVVSTTNSWVTALDNLSGIPDWLSDALCRLSTGGGFVTRELYTDAEEVIFDAQRPVVLTGIAELATRSDLLDRALLVSLPRISEEARLPEDHFWKRFEETKPRILGALLDAVSCALRNRAEINLDRLPRMADFAIWSAAAAPALGWSAEEFLAAYERNRAAVHEVALEDTLIGHPLLAVGQAGFEGTATELLRKLASLVDESTSKERGWPKTARALSGQLRRLAPNLRALGVDVEFGRETTGQKRRIVALSSRQGHVTRVAPGTTPLTVGGAGDASQVAGVTLGDEPVAVERPAEDIGDTSDAGDATAPHPATAAEQSMIERLQRRHSDLVDE